MATAESSQESACCLCFCDTDIFSIGDCNHPVCYECSTRMRVLCENCQCPICRIDLPQVLFTDSIGAYQDLKKEGNIMDKTHNIGLFFKNRRIQEKFCFLLEIVCQYCQREKFKNFNLLRDHVKRKHQLFFCDICVDNLKIFPNERKSYSRSELARHRRKGDPDDTSHRGHPLCEFCDTRFLDEDELFKHLRREHYFCHFCDTDDGAHYFYGDYESLRDHFKSEHYLCEIDNCKRDRFVAAFRTELDLKAHRANEHYQNLKGAAAKQMRTLELEFSVAGGVQRKRKPNSREPRREEGGSETTSGPLPEPPSPSFDGTDFPVLCGGKSSDTQSFSLTNTMAQRVAKQNMFNVGPGPREPNKEDFPALGGLSAAPPANTQVKPPKITKKKTVNLCINNQQDFPSLNPTKQRNGNVSQPNPRITKVTSSQNITVQGNRSLTLSGIGASLLSAETPQSPNVTTVEKSSTVQKSSSQKPPQTDSAQDFPSLSATIKPTKKGKASSVTIPLCNAWNREQQEQNVSKNVSAVENGRHEHKKKERVKSKLTIGRLSTAETNGAPTMGKYFHPSDYTERNHALTERVQQVVDRDKCDRFVEACVKLRNGTVDAAQYYDMCKEALGSQALNAVLGELLVLLPDIRLQNVLMKVVGGSLEGTSICAKCQQVLACKDCYEHERSHGLEGNFPSLS